MERSERTLSKKKNKFGKDIEAMKKEAERLQQVTKDVDEELRRWGKFYRRDIELLPTQHGHVWPSPFVQKDQEGYYSR